MEITIGSSTYIINGFFKDFDKTVSEKLYGIMEKDVEYAATARYNDNIPKDCLGWSEATLPARPCSLAVGEIRRTAI